MANRFALSLAESMRSGLPGLSLRGSSELVCMNMMCDKVGQTCLCQLSMVLERLQHLQHLDLSSNQLDRLPEVWHLRRLETLDVSDNNLSEYLPRQLSRVPLRAPLPRCVHSGPPDRALDHAALERSACGEQPAAEHPRGAAPDSQAPYRPMIGFVASSVACVRV